MTAALLDAVVGSGWQLTHVDTSDHRSIGNIGRFDPTNVLLALRHAADFTLALLRTRPDVVYLPLSQGVGGFTRDALFLVATRLSAAKLVVHAHGGQYREFYEGRPAFVRAVMRFCMARVQMVLVLADCQSHQFDGWVSPRVDIEVVPNGVRDEWPSGPPQRPPEGTCSVLYLGSLLPQKGFLDVLDAMPSVLRDVPNARFVFAGKETWDAETSARVRERMCEPGPRDATTFTGVVGPAERRELLETTDIVVFPPRWNEGQPLVVLEAMSAGLPVVVTESGGLAETVCDGREAIVVPKRDSDAIAVAVTRLLTGHELRARMGAAARARFLAEYTLGHWTSRMIRAFDAAQGRPGCGR